MLVLSRRKSESISVGDNITITVVAISGNRVKIGIEAPQEVQVLRYELLPLCSGEREREEERDAA